MALAPLAQKIKHAHMLLSLEVSWYGFPRNGCSFHPVGPNWEAGSALLWWLRFTMMNIEPF
jgi:hypothetical protein